MSAVLKPSLSYAVIATLLAGCATPPPMVPASAVIVRDGSEASAASLAAAAKKPTIARDTPKALPDSPTTNQKGGPAKPKVDEKADISLTFDQMPLPTFVQAVYGSILKSNFSMDPQIASRQDLVTLRTSKPQTPSEVADTARLVLKGYGVAVNDMGGGFLRIAPDSNQNAYLPQIRRGRALPDTPLPLRPVFYWVEMSTVRGGEIMSWLRTLYGSRLQINEDAPRNAIMLSGQSEDVSAALEVIRILDQPTMKGRNSIKISPEFWAVDDFAKRLSEVLQNEGYGVGIGVSTSTPISILPINGIGSLLVFGSDAKTLEHVAKWAAYLDSSQNSRSGAGYFIYNVKHADAQAIAQTLQSIIAGGAAAAGGKTAGARVVVSAPTNSLILQGSAEEYTQWLNLLKDLDRPVKTALIEVTVAEVKLADKFSLGVEWEWSRAPADAVKGITGTALINATAKSSGVTANFVTDLARLKGNLSALASANRATLLFTPRIMARNGESATIQVGQEVPIITSQQSDSNTNTNNGGPLQTVQYRTSGVVLKVRPVIHAGGRVELEISQEVSSPTATDTGVSSSPTFSTKRVDTKLSIRDGATVLIGGLIEQRGTDNNAGVPFLKDLPLVGQLFGRTQKDDDRTELLVLITPYILNDDYETEAISDALRAQTKDGWGRATSDGLSVIPNRPAAPPVMEAPKASIPSVPTPVVAEPAEPLPATSLSDGSKGYETTAVDTPRADTPVSMQEAAGVNDAAPPIAAPATPVPVAPKAAAPAAAPKAGAPRETVVTDKALLDEILRAAKGQGK
ncbi:type II secretion system protein [Chitinimonas prasina]|uniref:Type II secretion system protein n=1 Tax=Chitinimonas prasina TaxID=1434937 RepID=A0ABQ5YAH1_9NEIS|nr:secretin N-terminal domain-containing protein [Chitinimonas prasina]GLR11945.1 type II secretion system protein [Chitinimonas prasina]